MLLKFYFVSLRWRCATGLRRKEWISSMLYGTAEAVP